MVIDIREETDVRRVVHRMGATRRLIHWANVVAIVIAVITGMYIADPYYSSGITHVMSVNRTLHFYSAVVLDVTVIVTAYLSLFSRQDRSALDLIPNAANRYRLREAVFNLITFNRRRRFDTSRPDPLNALMFAVLHLLAVAQLFTGFQMYVQGLEGGTSSIGPWWPWLLHVTTDWTQVVFGGLAGLRLVHHAVTYPIVIWVLLHVYYEIWRSVMWKEADIAISIAGHKLAHQQQPVEPSVGGPG
jgi:Ni/Fe-hydrogenase 1 B-type cytochrome subunit